MSQNGSESSATQRKLKLAAPPPDTFENGQITVRDPERLKSIEESLEKEIVDASDVNFVFANGLSLQKNLLDTEKCFTLV